jgi:regulator of protease activity HflC (stomatin/prohibitin superfamily)
MESAFAWLGQVIEAILSFVPRLILVRATHQGVKWKYGKKAIRMDPGLHIYWPLVSDYELIVTARQTLNLPTQSLMTKDKKQVVVGSVIVYRVKDAVEAIGERNWDVDSTLRDITQAAVVEVVASSTLDDLLAGIADGHSDLIKTLTETVRKELRQFGCYIHQAKFSDFSTSKVFNIMGGNPLAKQNGLTDGEY